MRKAKTIFGRVLFSNLMILFLCVILLGTLSFAFFGSYTVGEKKETLQEEVSHVSQLTVFYEDNPGPTVSSLYFMSINEIADRIGGVVFLLGEDGTVLTGSRNMSAHINGNMPDSYVAHFFKSQTAQLGRFGGFFRDAYLLVTTPIAYHGRTPAAACIAVPMPQINRYRFDLFFTVLWAILLTMLLAVTLSFFISRHISRPLKEISNAAKSIMKGDFSVEVPVYGNDEIAVLSETFNQMTYSLRKLEEMRDGFIQNVSHELRTPMTTISGFIEGILDNTIPKERQEEYLTIVLSEAKRLSRLTNELLLVARMEDGLRLKRSDFDLCELIRISLLRFESVFTEKNIEPVIEFDKENCIISGDRDALDRVFINLFDNALKFNRDGGYVRISVVQNDATVSVTVENSGEGIAEEDIQLIWDKFYKTDRSRSKDKTGVGLGLYLVRNIINAHGGKIHAESVPESFTRFVITLPRK